MAENKELKRNDIFLNLMSNPTYRTVDFMDVGLNSENTTILSADKYKENEKIKSNPLFQTDGKFDENKFNSVYNTSVMMFNEMSQTSMDDAISKEIEYQPGSLFATELDNPKFINPQTQVRIAEYGVDTNLNPNRDKYNTTQIGRVSEGEWTPQELAQMHKTYNRDTGEWEDSPETWFGKNWFSKFWNPPVMATYDETDPEVRRGEKKVGEYKLNDDGTYYAERITGQPMYNKETISMWDTLTKEGSWLNRYDFFDSDDKKKSVAGSIFKTVATVAPMFIPGVGTYYIGLSVGYQTSKLSTTLARMLGGGTDSEFLNYSENFLNQFGMNVSQHSKTKAFTVENFIGLAGDVFTQLKQQRWIFKNVPKMFGYKTDALDNAAMDKMVKAYEKSHLSELNKINGNKILNNAKNGSMLQDELRYIAQTKAIADVDLYRRNFQKVGSVLSKAYMTGITTMDSYNHAKKEGASDMQAGMLALGYSLGEYALLNTAIGEMVMPEVRLDRQMLKKSIATLNGLEKKAVSLGTQEAKRSFIKKGLDLGRGLAQGRWHGGKTATAIAANALGEGIEETSEELLYDFTKSVYNTYFWLTGDKQRYEAWNDMGTRYSMSFIGGLMGGGLFASTETFHGFGKDGPLANMNTESANQHILYLLREGKRGEIEREMRKMTFGSKDLSATKLLGSDYESGFAPGTETDNQDKALKDAFVSTLDMFEGIMDGAGIKMADDAVIDASLLRDVRFNMLSKSTSAAVYLQDFNTSVSDYYNAYKEYQEAYNNVQTGNKNKPSPSDSSKPMNDNEASQAHLDEKKNAMLEARAKAQSYVNGERSGELVLRGIFETNPFLHETFKTMSFDTWIDNKYGDRAASLSKEELAAEYQSYSDNYIANSKDDLRVNFDIFYNIFKKLNPALTKEQQTFYEDIDYVPQINAFVNQIENDNKYLQQALASGESGNSGLFDSILETVSNPNRLFLTPTGPGGVDMDYVPFASGIYNPAVDYNTYIDKAIEQLGDVTDENVIQETKNKAAIEWYRGFVGKYTAGVSDVLNVFSKKDYVSPQLRRQLASLHTTYKNLVENKAYNKDALDNMQNAVFEFNADNDLIFDNESQNSDITAEEYYKQKNKEEVTNAISFMGYMSKKAGEVLPLIKPDALGSISNDNINTVIDILNEMRQTYAPYSNPVSPEFNMDVDAVVSKFIGDIENNIVSVSQNNEFYNFDQASEINSAMDEIAKKPLTPIYSAMDQIYVLGGRKSSDVIADIERSFTTASTSPQGFNLSSEQITYLDSVLNQIGMMRSVIYASRNDNGDIVNPEGFALLSNKMMNGKDGYTEMNVINSEFSGFANADLDRLESRLRMIKAISSFNGTRKLEEDRKMFVNRSAITYRMLNKLKETNPDIVDFTEIDAAMADPDMDIIKEIVGQETPTYSLSNDKHNAMFGAITKLEKAVHNAFKDVATDEATMEKILSTLDLLQPVTDVFNLETKYMDPNSYAWFLAHLISTDADAVNGLMTKTYDKMDIAPTAAQEMAVRGTISFMSGRDTYKAMARAYKKVLNKKVDDAVQGNNLKVLSDSLKKLNLNIDKYIDEYNKADAAKDDISKKTAVAKIKFYVSNSNAFNVFDSAYAIAGIPGAGKSKGTIAPIIRTLAQRDENGNSMIENADKLLSNVYVVSTENAKDELGAIIKSELRPEQRSKTMTHSELLTDLFGKDAEKRIHESITADLSDGADHIAHTTVRSTKTATSEWPSMIIVDEFTLFDQFDADAINTFADEHNIPVIFLGDDQQSNKPTPVKGLDINMQMNGKKIVVDGDFIFSLSESQFMRSPKLGSSMRVNNSQKEANVRLMRMAMLDLLFGRQAAVELSSYNSGNAFYGDMVSKGLTDDVKAAIDTMVKDSKEGKIGYIYDENSEVFKYLQSKGLISTAKDENGNFTSDVFRLYNNSVGALGLELKYYIFDKKNIVYTDKTTEFRDLYVAMSRSRQGSLIIGDYSQTSLKLSHKSDTETIISTYDESSIKDFTRRYIDMVNATNEGKAFDRLKVKAPVYDTTVDPGLPPPPTGDPDPAPGTSLPDSSSGVDVSQVVDDEQSNDETDKNDPPLPPELPIGPVQGDGVLEKTVVMSDKDTNGVVKSYPIDAYTATMMQANESGDTPAFNNVDMIDRGYVFNVFEIGKNVTIDEKGVIAYDVKCADSVNGFIRILKALVGEDGSLVNGVFSSTVDGDGIVTGSSFDFATLSRNAGSNIDGSRAGRIMEGMLSDIHNGFMVGKSETERIDNIKAAIDNILQGVLADKYTLELKAKFNSFFNTTNNTTYGIKKLITEGNNKYDTANPNVTNGNIEVFGDEANSEGLQTKFVMIMGKGEVDGFNTSLLEIPLFTPPNIITSISRNEEFVDELIKSGFVFKKGDNNYDNNWVLDTLINGKGGMIDRTDMVIVSQYLNSLATYGNISEQGKKTAKYYSAMVNMYNLTMPGFSIIDSAKFNKMIDEAEFNGVQVYSKMAGHEYLFSNEYIFQPKRMLLSDIAVNPKFNVSNIMSSRINDEKYGLKAKLPFVIVGVSNSVSRSNLFDVYKAEIDNGVKRRTTKLVYVTPPSVSFSDYMNKLKNILGSKLTATDKVIGNSFSSYRILKNIFTDENGEILEDTEFKATVRRIAGIDYQTTVGDKAMLLSDYIRSTLESFMAKESDTKAMRNMLIDNSGNKILNGILFMLTSELTPNGDITNFREDAANTISEILNSKNFIGVHLFPKSVRGMSDVSNVILDENGLTSGYSLSVDGVSYPFTIFGRVDSPVFSVDYTQVIDAIDEINPRGSTYNNARDYYRLIEGTIAKKTATPTPPKPQPKVPKAVITYDVNLSGLFNGEMTNVTSLAEAFAVATDEDSKREAFSNLYDEALKHGYILMSENGLKWSGLNIGDEVIDMLYAQDIKEIVMEHIIHMDNTRNSSFEITINDNLSFAVMYDSHGLTGEFLFEMMGNKRYDNMFDESSGSNEIANFQKSLLSEMSKDDYKIAPAMVEAAKKISSLDPNSDSFVSEVRSFVDANYDFGGVSLKGINILKAVITDENLRNEINKLYNDNNGKCII